ncbi:hypothetical protein BH10PSE7_BH10PSE7_16730 [soil metagenome]
MFCPRPLLDRKPERLVVTGLRCCLAGYDFGDIECWETAWRSYRDELGTVHARQLIGELQFWVRTIRAEAVRPLTVYPYGCTHVCRDECMALSLIAALQDRDTSTAFMAAYYLSGGAARDAAVELVASGEAFAALLFTAGQKLLSVPPGVVLAIACHDCEPSLSTSLH